MMVESVLHVDRVERADGLPVELTGQTANKLRAKINQQGTQSVLDSFNVSSIVDGGTGKTEVNSTNWFVDVDRYTYVTGSHSTTGTHGANWASTQSGQTPTASMIPLISYSWDATVVDLVAIHVIATGDLA